MSYTTESIILSSQNDISTNSNELNVQLPSVWYANNSEIALASLYIYYSWFNITSTFANNACTYTWTNGTTYPVAFPNGYYLPADISGFLQYTMNVNGHYLVNAEGANVYYISVVENSVYYADSIVVDPIPTVLATGWTNPNAITLNGLRPQLNILSSNSFGAIIGFNVGSYPPIQAGTAYSVNSQNVPQVTPVASVNITCNLANTGNFNQIQGIIGSFATGSTAIGQQIIVNPTFPVYYKVNDGRYANISVSFLDNNNKPLQIVDPVIIVTLTVRTLKK